MTYALNLTEDGRVLSVTYPMFAPKDAVKVDELPDGDVSEYRYDVTTGEFIHDPLPEPEVDEQPTQLDIIEAQVTYTAMMTGSLLEV
jgi:hypothetical protein